MLFCEVRKADDDERRPLRDRDVLRNQAALRARHYWYRVDEAVVLVEHPRELAAGTHPQ